MIVDQLIIAKELTAPSEIPNVFCVSVGQLQSYAQSLSGRLMIIMCELKKCHVPVVMQIAHRFEEIKCHHDSTVIQLHEEFQEKISEYVINWTPGMKIRRTSNLIYVVTKKNMHTFPYDCVSKIKVKDRECVCNMFYRNYDSVFIDTLDNSGFWQICHANIKHIRIQKTDQITFNGILEYCRWSEIYIGCDLEVYPEISISPFVKSIRIYGDKK